jgi:hypothetical protein
MKHTLWILACSVATVLAGSHAVQAQVYVRVPFVRVEVGGGGVAVRAPFVNLFVPPGPTYYPGPVLVPGPMQLPGEFFPAPQPRLVPMPEPIPAPQPKFQVPDDGPPPPVQQGPMAMTAEAFVKSFQPKAGSYEVTILNPITKQPTPVRFTLPEGTPKRVNVNRREIEFFYGPRNFVRIEFDRDGAQVISR